MNFYSFKRTGEMIMLLFVTFEHYLHSAEIEDDFIKGTDPQLN